MAFRAAVIGCGGRGRAHAQGYADCPKTELIACADTSEENRTRLARQFGVPGVYADYRELLEKERPDIVSICTWPGLHKEMSLAAAAAGVKAIHSEKPMAPTFGEAKAILVACEQSGTVITYCHQGRMEREFVTARHLAQQGAIGQLLRVEGYCDNLFDWGTHWFDMFFFYNGDVAAEWVLAQIDVETERSIFGVPLETRGLAHIKYRNDVHGLLVTGAERGGQEETRLIGTEGVIEVNRGGKPLRLWNRAGYAEPAFERVLHPNGTTATIFDLVDALEAARAPELIGRKALAASECIFASYESARRRAKVALPLETEDSALLTMLERGEIKPAQA